MKVQAFNGNSLLHETKHDICDNKPKPNIIRTTLAIWAIPDFCPIKKSFKFCYNDTEVIKLSMVSQKIIELFYVAKPTFKISITHDTGPTCLEALSGVRKIH